LHKLCQTRQRRSPRCKSQYNTCDDNKLENPRQSETAEDKGNFSDADAVAFRHTTVARRSNKAVKRQKAKAQRGCVVRVLAF
jgi:hypothetical protein